MAVWASQPDRLPGRARGSADPQFHQSWLSAGSEWAGCKKRPAARRLHGHRQIRTNREYRRRDMVVALGAAPGFIASDRCLADRPEWRVRNGMADWSFRVHGARHRSHSAGLVQRWTIAAFFLAVSCSVSTRLTTPVWHGGRSDHQAARFLRLARLCG